MNVLKRLSQKVSDKPYHGFTKLPLRYHEIVCFRESEEKYGQNLIAELKHELIYLPQYIVEKLDNNDIDQLNQCEETCFF